MEDKDIETLVNKGYMDSKSAARYYEDSGNYREAIRHYAGRDYDKAFHLAIDHNHHDLARGLIEKLENSVKMKRANIIRIREEEKYRDPEEGGSMGRLIGYCSEIDQVEHLSEKIEDFKKQLESSKETPKN
jgi:hypothetical protein